MLLDKPFHLEKGWEQIPFVSCSVDRIGQGFTVVEWLEEGVEALNSISNNRIIADPRSYISAPSRLSLVFRCQFFLFRGINILNLV